MNKRILIATGIYPPEIGGPAGYVGNLAEKFTNLGIDVCVITYSDEKFYDIDKELKYKLIRIKRINKVLNYIRFFIAVLKKLPKYDIVYCFDYFSAGIPSIFASKILHKKSIIRIGGDFMWENYLSKTKNGITLKNYYLKNVYKKDFVRFFIVKLVLKFTNALVFTTKFQKEIFQNPYNLRQEKIYYISNPIILDTTILEKENVNNDILVAGRIIVKNNIENLIKAFSQISQDKYRLVVIGNGYLKEQLINFVKENNIKNVFLEDGISNKELREKIHSCYAMIFPSYTDISPNTVLDCISMKTPFIMTKEHGFDWLKGIIPEFDPENLSDIKLSIEKIMNIDTHKQIQEKVNNINYAYSYDDVVKETLNVFQKI